MFEIGKWYTVWMGEGEDVGRLDYRVADFQFPLLKLQNPHMNDMIVNTSAPSFVRAQLSRHQEDRQGESPIGGLNDDSDFT